LISAKQVNDVIEIKFISYLDMNVFKNFVDRIKSIPGRKFEGGSTWVIPCSQKECLQKLFSDKELVWEEVRSDSSSIIKDIPIDMEYLDELKLQPYPFQVLGINFLCSISCGMIADEMGLGKSLQIISAVYKLYRAGGVKRALIICPSTLKYQWEQEIEKFVDVDKYGIDYVVVDGTPKKREEIYESIKDSNILYTIINYELVLRDIDQLSQIEWDIIACDEFQRVKNFRSQTSKAFQYLKAPFKWAATGTPMQNKPEELFNLFAWINPKVLGEFWKFRNRYMIIGEKFHQPNMVLGYRNLSELHNRISPYMLRRLKKDVAPQLPKMLINNVFVDMTPDQIKIHEQLRSDLFDLIKEVSKYTVRNEDGEIIGQHPKANSILGMFVMMQEVCDSPQLLLMSESGMAKHYTDSKIDPKSPKIEELKNILKDFLNNDTNMKKAVIFTQFERMQRLIAESIEKLGKYRVINGHMTAQEKQAAITEFRKDPDISFLLSTDSGNYGVNIPEASLLVSVDLPWNPAVWQQRNARIHRLDSTYESVNIVNLISVGGLDEKILETIYNKMNMASEIVENRMEETEYLSTLTHSIIKKLLTKKKHKNAKKSEDDLQED
jgi:SNF2 family DNA or RNA helicase